MLVWRALRREAAQQPDPVGDPCCVSDTLPSCVPVQSERDMLNNTVTLM